MELITNSYKSDGYCKLDSFFDITTIENINKLVDNIQFDPKNEMFDEDGSGKIKQIQYLYNYGNDFQNMIDELRPIAEHLTGHTELDVLNMQLFEKHPGISKHTRAHQDNAYFKVTPAIAITFWISLDNIDEENGALFYAPKTHLTPTRKHQRYHKSTTFRVRSGVPGLSLCLHEHPSETDQIQVTNKGDVLIHHCNLVHRAEKNNSKDRRRRAIGIVFIPKICNKDQRLVGYFENQLREDIELQEFKNPSFYRELKDEYSYLWS